MRVTGTRLPWLDIAIIVACGVLLGIAMGLFMMGGWR
jgi:hypothetical protein